MNSTKSQTEKPIEPAQQAVEAASLIVPGQYWSLFYADGSALMTPAKNSPESAETAAEKQEISI